MHKRFARFSLVLGMACALAACGFQLRGVGTGHMALPDDWKHMHLVTGNPNGEFSRAVAASLAAQGVQWTDRGKANFSLVLGPEHFEQRNFSLNSEARVAEYELAMRAEFSVVDSNNTEIVAPTVVSVVKQMENDPRNVVGKDSESQLLQGEMRTELANQITRRVSFLAAATSSP